METQTSTTGKGVGFPKTKENPDGYTKDDRARTMRGKDRAGTGRKDHEGTPEIVKFESITKGCSEMMKAFVKVKNAEGDFDTVCAAVAERSNCNVTTLKRLVRSSYKGNFKDVKDKIDQEQEVFAVVGEIAGGKQAAV